MGSMSDVEIISWCGIITRQEINFMAYSTSLLKRLGECFLNRFTDKIN
jgi:hypothetical protein